MDPPKVKHKYGSGARSGVVLCMAVLGVCISLELSRGKVSHI